MRPFWGRVAAWIGGSAFAGYALAVVAVLLFLRLAAGTPVTVAQVAWPGRWREIRQVQAEVFFGRALEAFRRGRFDEAHLALVSARARYPDHYPASLLLGQIAMFRGAILFADDYFTQLLARFPEKRLQTAVTYHDTLLGLGRLDPLASFSLRMAAEDASRAAVWARSLIVILGRHPNGAEFAARHQQAITRLAPHAQMLVDAERLLASGDRAAAVALLGEPFRGPLNPVYMSLQVERLAELGRFRDAQMLLDFYGPVLGPFESRLVQYTIDRLEQDAFAARASLRYLLELPLTEAQVARLAERLVRWPDAEASVALRAALEARPELANARISTSLWVVALVSDRPDDAAAWRSRAARVEGVELPPLNRVDFRSRDFQDRASARSLANTVDLPREVVFALALRSAEALAMRTP